jgi:hypothetical protein
LFMPLVFYSMVALVQEFLPPMLARGDGAILTAHLADILRDMHKAKAPAEVVYPDCKLPAGRHRADNAGLNPVPLCAPEPGRRQQPPGAPPGARLAAAAPDQRGQ